MMSERRRFLRKAIQLQVLCQSSEDPNTNVKAWTYDVSQCGMALRM